MVILPKAGMLFWMVMLICKSATEAVVLALLVTEALSRPPTTEIGLD